MGLRPLAGVSLGGGESSEAQIAQEIMKSWSFIESFIANNNLAVEVFAAEGWSKGSNSFRLMRMFMNSEQTMAGRRMRAGKVGPPSSWQLFETFLTI